MTDNDFREPTGMYNIPAITAQISKNKDIRKKRVEHLKENWGETDEMKRQKKKKENKGN